MMRAKPEDLQKVRKKTAGKMRPAGRRPPDEPQELPGLATTRLSTVKPEPVRFLVPGLIPLGKNILVAGDGGQGKSTITLELTARVTTGQACFGLTYAPPPPAEVLLISCEDDTADTVVPRLLSAGADLSKVYRVDGIKTKGGKPAPFCLAHYERMQEELAARPGVRLVVIDPAGAYVGRSGVDDYKDSELRTLLDPMARLAAEQRVTILLVKHLIKGATLKAVHKVGGSAGYVNNVRAAFLVAPDPADDAKKHFLPIKFNLGAKPAGLAYRMRALEADDRDWILDHYAGHLEEEDRDRLAGQLFRVEWLGASDADADALLGEAARWSRGAGRVQECADWLETFLAGFAYPSDEIKAAGEKAGFSFDNVKEAKAKLKNEKGLRHSNRGRFRASGGPVSGIPTAGSCAPLPTLPTLPTLPSLPTMGSRTGP